MIKAINGVQKKTPAFNRRPVWLVTGRWKEIIKVSFGWWPWSRACRVDVMLVVRHGKREYHGEETVWMDMELGNVEPGWRSSYYSRRAGHLVYEQGVELYILRALDCWDEKLRLKRNHGRGETGHGKLSSRKSQPWDKWACFTEVCSAALCQVNERMRKESNLARGLLWRCSRGSPLGLCFLICKADFYSSPTCPQNGGENQMHQCACDCQPGWQRRRHSYRWLWLLPC